jgi:hypothetical protein
MDSVEHPLHIKDLLNSDKVSSSQAKSLIKSGWQLRSLTKRDCYCSFGAAGLYTHCLHDGQRGLRQLTDKATKGLKLVDQTPAPVLLFDQTWVILKVPFEGRSEAKAAGAEWLPIFKHWGCTPAQAEEGGPFSQWLTSPLITAAGEEDRLLLSVPREDVEAVKATGAFRGLNDTGGAWYCFRANAEHFERWLS